MGTTTTKAELPLQTTTSTTTIALLTSEFTTTMQKTTTVATETTTTILETVMTTRSSVFIPAVGSLSTRKSVPGVAKQGTGSADEDLGLLKVSLEAQGSTVHED